MLPAFVFPLIMLLALLSGAILLRRSQQGLALSKEHRIAIGLAAFCGAMLGAKLPFALSDWSGLLDGTAWFQNGKTIMCGMVGAYLAVELAKWTLGIKTKTGDSFVVPVAVTVAIGRLGCLSAGCCYGIPTDVPWALRCAAVDELARHPTQLYEAAFHFSAAGIAILLMKRGIWCGQLVKAYILSYLLYRLLTETIRPEERVLLALTWYQWFAICAIPIFLWLWWHDRHSIQLVKATDVQ